MRVVMELGPEARDSLAAFLASARTREPGELVCIEGDQREVKVSCGRMEPLVRPTVKWGARLP